MSAIDKDFENFFNSLKKQQFSNTEILKICKPLTEYYRLQKFKKWFLILICLCIVYALIEWCDSFNWFLTALGRLLLIQMLPYWNWPELYNAKCLIDRSAEINSRPLFAPKLNRYETDKENCVLCDTIDYIPSVSNTTPTFLENFYLERGFPIIITDSHDPMPPKDIYNLIFSKSLDFLESKPCDISTNLMLNKFFDIEIALRKAWNMYDDSQDKWYLQLRNCQFKAVKSSRNFIKRPYYYPVHLEPFYSCWLIMSQNYVLKEQQEIYLHGLIIVQQLWGSMDLSLKPKTPCENCPIIKVHLTQGESLVFSTDLWLLSYKFGNEISQSITTIMEIDWNF